MILVGLVQNTPGIEACGLTDVLPLEGDRSWSVAGAGQVYDRENYPSAYVRIVSNGYFKAMGIPLLASRDFTEHDRASSEQVIIINDTLARRLWPGQDPIGQMVTQDGGRRVVGVVVESHDPASFVGTVVVLIVVALSQGTSPQDVPPGSTQSPRFDQISYCGSTLPQKSKQSAKGAEYESQGQARSEAERVAPGKVSNLVQR